MMINKGQQLTSYKFYWGGIADFKGLASNLALNVSTGNRFEDPQQNLYVTLPPIVGKTYSTIDEN